MSFPDRVRLLAKRAPELLPHLETEGAMKTALVLPFLSALGYDVFDPTEVVPEFVADVGIKKGEKVDYVVKRDGAIQILIECKPVGTRLKIEHASQLYRYFSVTKARIAILTNGMEYHLCSDLDEPNKLDARPFLILNLLELRDDLVAEVASLSKSAFDLEKVLSSANDLKYLREVRACLERHLEEPEEELVKFFFSRANPTGRFTAASRTMFSPLVKKALLGMISERVSDRLRAAIAREDPGASTVPLAQPTPPEPAAETESGTSEAKDGIATTQEELDGLRVVLAIVCSEVAPERVVYRDAKSYFAILLDDNNRRPICRLHFNAAQKYLGLLDDAKQETRHPSASVRDLYAHADALRAAVRRYRGDKSEPEATA
jgi:hypothetical protein